MTDPRIAKLPTIFNAYKDKIIQSQRPSIVMTLHPKADLTLWQSKVGGEPYLPLAMSYPTNQNDERLKLLAQINFAEVPENDIYPKQGILQFYIDADDDLSGLNFDDQTDQTGFRVIFHEHLVQDTTQLQQFGEHNPLPEAEYCPISGEYAVAFELQTQYISIQDWQFAPLLLGVEELHEFEEKFEGGDFYDDFVEVYGEYLTSTGHRLGGYPFFTQSDPRYTDDLQEYQLLFQLDTDNNEEVNIMWGDVGVGNFFIRPKDLKNKDFSKILYNWDCS